MYKPDKAAVNIDVIAHSHCKIIKTHEKKRVLFVIVATCSLQGCKHEADGLCGVSSCSLAWSNSTKP